MKARNIITTADGSHSIYVPELNEHYHSHHGSITESQHIFVQAGLGYFGTNKNQLKVFEMGLGTGLNVLCSIIYQEENKLQIDYTSIEKYPITIEESQKLNYVELLGKNSLNGLFKKIHRNEWGEKIQLSKGFSLKKLLKDIKNAELKESEFDIIFYDAFAPEVQADLWTKEMLQKMYAILVKGGVLVSYCVKGAVRRNLKEVGFKVEKLNGPKGGKREILRAVKI